MLIRVATSDDADALWHIMEPIIRAGETYALPQAMSKAEAMSYWLGSGRETFAAVADGRILGTYYIRPNQPGRGDHVANCGYMTAAEARGRGIARRMFEHSMAYAEARGFKAMQFNFVIETNEPALRLWQSLGFDIVGRLPKAYRHPCAGFVDALVMFRALSAH
jgi:GNAT superfamily N-acetyltransferase